MPSSKPSQTDNYWNVAMSDINRVWIDCSWLNRLEFNIQISEELLKKEIPRLIIQPIVENAIIHGIEKNPKAKTIEIFDVIKDEYYILTISDDGGMIDTNILKKIDHNIHSNLKKEDGCGSWNVHNRLINIFGEDSGLRFSINQKNGLNVNMMIPLSLKKEK